jgi:energy-coupling factor transport system substrate-specific component
VSLIGLVAFGWPLLISSAATIPADLAPGLTAIILIVALLVLLTAISSKQLNSKVIALLGLLAALIAAARLLGAHAFGIEPMWAFIAIAGRALGPIIGFSAGSLGMASSALITGGLGPWLPFQMLAAGWVGLLAGLLPLPKSKIETPLLATFGAVAALFVGLLLNLWFWPTAVMGNAALAFVPGDSIWNNLTKLLAYSLATSASFDIPRAIMTFVLILLIGGSMLRTLRRINRPVEFVLQEKAN